MTIRNLKLFKTKKNTLSNNLTRLLEASHISEQEIARALGLPALTIKRIVSGETADPRISTLQSIADYLGVSIDALLDTKESFPLNKIKKNVPKFVPILNWEIMSDKSLKEIDLSLWSDWLPIADLPTIHFTSNSFGLKSRPSMKTRFPEGTVFIFEPDEKPRDGDLILVKTKQDHSLSLREFIMDSPECRLQPVVPGSDVIIFSEENHSIIGVVIFTFFSPRS